MEIPWVLMDPAQHSQGPQRLTLVSDWWMAQTFGQDRGLKQGEPQQGGVFHPLWHWEKAANFSFISYWGRKNRQREVLNPPVQRVALWVSPCSFPNHTQCYLCSFHISIIKERPRAWLHPSHHQRIQHTQESIGHWGSSQGWTATLTSTGKQRNP